MNPALPSKSLRQFYWENEEVQKSLEGNSNNWKVYNKGKKLKKQTNSKKEGTNSNKKQTNSNKKQTNSNKKGTNSPKKRSNLNKRGTNSP